MGKKEKYYKFIVGDLVKKLKIYYRKGILYHHYENGMATIIGGDSFGPPTSFKNYVVKYYGVHESEVDPIWGLYKEKLPRSY